ncbi:bifunctional diguanylate cyclase/phosphodiesterase [Thioalkalivibrio sp. ALJ2]|uniref:putative bifunctional diguanylate cyclase/phosphodiesterase n=1 Tax=Thioalkalivibrio sp. ALJ2 TaxID=1261622 RepID=UPI00037CBB69|nr:bifunctional diguanylate cyclase/phosphodiesterase [Thioalkalivibrio sp. ALJ2]
MSAERPASPRRALRLRLFIVAAIMGVALLVFLTVHITSTLIYERTMARQAEQTASGIAHQTFASMFQIMREGWTREQLEAFSAGIKESLADTPLQLDFYRGEKVSALYGDVDQPAWHERIEHAFETGAIESRQDNGELRYTFPLRARNECLACHGNASSGDVLGVMEVRQDLGTAISEARNQHVWTFLGTGLGTLLLGSLIAAWATAPITRSVRRFQDQVTRVNAIKDLNHVETQAIDTGFVELNQVVDQVDDLVRKLRAVAVDKDILEFELKLLDKFIITSDVVRDWREYIGVLLTEINTIIDAYTLFTLFKANDDVYELEIFWRAEPTEATRRTVERLATHRIRASEEFVRDANISVRHNVADASSHLPELSPRQIELATKSLVLDTPRIGGVVGIGVQSDLVRDPVRHVVIESILSTLLNLVGSVKAIYKYTQDLEYYATRDPLTNLYNQRVFWELFNYEIKRAEGHGYPFAVMVVDLDNFKTINDRYGHAFGDRFLQAYAETIQGAIRNEDILARYGGDEFALILPETDQHSAWQLAAHMAEATDGLSLPAPDGSRVKATTCIGIAAYPRHGKDTRDLFLVADNMMYKAKREGKNAVCVPSDEEVAAVFREAGETGIMIMEALEDRRIVPYFQPIMDTATGEAHIHELLMRIRVGDELIPAGQFVEVAETMGVMHQLDYVLIEQAFIEVSRSGYSGLLFINLSPRALIIGEFIGKVRQLALDHGIEPAKVVFEITERDTVKNMAVLEQFVLDLKQQGFQFAVDDFGSGFSSFHYLKRFPIDFVKIEGDFVRNMVHDARDQAFVRSIAALARDLNVRTIAEYVEDAEILEAVKSIGIHYAQGFHVGHPGPGPLPGPGNGETRH